jgi:putative Mn2+ efflux pump MntP
MGFLSLVLVAIALSMDSFAVSTALGISSCKVSIKQTLRVALFLSVTQAIFPLLGWLTGETFSIYIREFDHWIAFVLLVIIGGQMIYEGFDNDGNKEDNKKQKCLSSRNLLLMGIATSIDAFIVGVSFAFLEVNIILATAMIFVVTMIFTYIGFSFSARIGNKCGKYSEIFGGLVLMAIGAKVLIEHLFFHG